MADKKIVKIAFIDRDGVINAYPGHFKYVTRLEEFHMLPRAAEGIRLLNRAGFKVVVVSNQAGVGKGLYTRETLDDITRVMKELLAGQGAVLDAVMYCTHRKEDNCACRKPAIGMLSAAIAMFSTDDTHVDAQRCVFIGDSMIDIATGKAAGIATILVFSGRERPDNRKEWETIPDYTAQDLAEAAAIACKQGRGT